MIAASSLFDAPSARIDFTRRSSDTVGSPASIFATRDWLDFSVFARLTWVTPDARRRALRPSASLSRSSIYISSWFESPRRSLVLPSFQPLDSSFLRLFSRIVILLKALPASVNDGFGCLTGLLGKYFENHNGIGVDSIHDAPGTGDVVYAQLMASRPDTSHRPRLRHRQQFTALELPQQESRLESGASRHRRGLDLAMKPCQRLVFGAHPK